MLTPDHPSEQLRFAPPDFGYFFDIEIIEVELMIKRVVAAARHRGNDEEPLQSPQPHDAADAQGSIICMRFDDEHPSAPSRRDRFDQLAKFASQELIDQ